MTTKEKMQDNKKAVKKHIAQLKRKVVDYMKQGRGELSFWLLSENKYSTLVYQIDDDPPRGQWLLTRFDDQGKSNVLPIKDDAEARSLISCAWDPNIMVCWAHKVCRWRLLCRCGELAILKTEWRRNFKMYEYLSHLALKEKNPDRPEPERRIVKVKCFCSRGCCDAWFKGKSERPESRVSREVWDLSEKNMGGETLGGSLAWP